MGTHRSIPINSINSVASYEKQLRSLNGVLSPFLTHAKSAMASPLAVIPVKAHALLEHGVRHYSKFGRTCPVALPQQHHSSGDANHENYVAERGRRLGPSSDAPDGYPVVYGPHVYFCRNEAARRAFMADPVTYTLQPEAQPRSSHRIIIVGAPQAGKTSLARQVADELGVELLDPCTCVAEVIKDVSWLGQQVHRTLLRGLELDTKLLCSAVCAVARRRRSWVLDGFPCTAEQARMLDDAGLDITGTVLVQASDEVVMRRADAHLHEMQADGWYARPKDAYKIPADPAPDGSPQEKTMPAVVPLLQVCPCSAPMTSFCWFHLLSALLKPADCIDFPGT